MQREVTVCRPKYAQPFVFGCVHFSYRMVGWAAGLQGNQTDSIENVRENIFQNVLDVIKNVGFLMCNIKFCRQSKNCPSTHYALT